MTSTPRTGLVVLGFPCDQFGDQEPGTEQEIAAFCETSYGVTFPMFAKLEVNGDGTHPLYAWLKSEQAGPQRRRHRLELHQVPRSTVEGRVVARFGPTTSRRRSTPDVEKQLAD